VVDIEVTNRLPVAIVARSLRHEVSEEYKDELFLALSEAKSIEVDPKRIELRWETVSLPSKPDTQAMMVQQISMQLVTTNTSMNPELYPRVYSWKFFRSKEMGDDENYSLAEGIALQKRYQAHCITAVVTGLGSMDICNTIPATDTRGKENTDQLKLLNILVGSECMDREDEDSEWYQAKCVIICAIDFRKT
jgi:hypothetical protein